MDLTSQLRRRFSTLTLTCLVFALAACSGTASQSETLVSEGACAIEIVVLGIGQDAGSPQIGNPGDPAWTDPSKRLYATSLGLLDHENNKRYLFEATPDIREQMQIMDQVMPPDGDGPYLDGVFLTHAHIGHYAGLMFLGRESMGASGVPVYAMPRMADYLENNGPWSQLVALGNITLEHPAFSLGLSGQDDQVSSLTVMPLQVPHRDEYSETVGYLISGDSKSMLFIPDIDDWDSWNSVGEDVWVFGEQTDPLIKGLIGFVDYAFVDATFYDDNELPGRDMSKIPHPRVTETMELVKSMGNDALKEKVHFIHINHTNPIRDPDSPQSQFVESEGFNIARRGDRICLQETD